jgi:crossover junction endodeoxyribonuclease RusA
VSDKIHIRVNGKPAPQGSKRHIGGGRMIESSEALTPWREAVRAEVQRVGMVMLSGPVNVQVCFAFARPAGHYRTGRNAAMLRDAAPRYPAGKKRNDLDKLVRAVLDGLDAGGAFEDDGQVVQLAAAKVYAPRGEAVGCDIWIGAEHG